MKAVSWNTTNQSVSVLLNTTVLLAICLSWRQCNRKSISLFSAAVVSLSFQSSLIQPANTLHVYQRSSLPSAHTTKTPTNKPNTEWHFKTAKPLISIASVIVSHEAVLCVISQCISVGGHTHIDTEAVLVRRVSPAAQINGNLIHNDFSMAQLPDE